MAKLGALHLTKHTGPKHTATMIFFHGSGDSGENMKEWVNIMLNTFSFPHIKVLFPTAPLQPYTPAGGEMSNVWFDRAAIAPNVPEKAESLNKLEPLVKELLKKENDTGIPSQRIVVGGFSMGGSVALHTAYRWERNVAGAFCFGSFLNDKSVLYEEIKNKSGERLPPLLMIHGDSDALVFPDWGKNTYSTLKSLGIVAEYHTMEKLGHSINKKGLRIIKEFVEKLLPEI